MAASFLSWPAGPAARPAGGDLAERAVAPGLLVFGRRAACGAPHDPRGVVPAGPFAGGGLAVPRGGFYRSAHFAGGALAVGGVSHAPRLVIALVLVEAVVSPGQRFF